MKRDKMIEALLPEQGIRSHPLERVYAGMLDRQVTQMITMVREIVGDCTRRGRAWSGTFDEWDIEVEKVEECPSDPGRLMTYRLYASRSSQAVAYRVEIPWTLNEMRVTRLWLSGGLYMEKDKFVLLRDFNPTSSLAHYQRNSLFSEWLVRFYNEVLNP